MKLNIATLVAVTIASPLTEKTHTLHEVEDTLTDGAEIDTQPTMETPDLKDFLSKLYGEAMTDNQILALLIGSTPSPQIEDDLGTTAATILDDTVTTAAQDLVEILSEESPEVKSADDQTNQELVHVLNTEMKLLEDLKKTEVELADELRELQIIKEQQSKLLDNVPMIELDVESSSTAMTSISTLCMALVALLLL